MKKTVFLLSMLFACTCVSAQNELTKVGEIEDGYGPAYYKCPKEFSYEGNVHFTIRERAAENDESGTMVFNIYNDELQKEKTISVSSTYLDYENFNADYYDGIDVYITQTLFNDDEKYEWVELVDNGVNYTGFKVMQEGNVELYSVDFDFESSTARFYIYLINEKVYLVTRLDGNIYYFYLIDSGEDTGIKYVGKVNGMSVSPTILNRSTPVTVDFADGSDVSHNITVTNSNGQVVDRQNVAAGQSSVALDTSHWGNGLNIVTTKNANNETQSCKIIVK